MVMNSIMNEYLGWWTEVLLVCSSPDKNVVLHQLALSAVDYSIEFN